MRTVPIRLWYLVVVSPCRINSAYGWRMLRARMAKLNRPKRCVFIYT